MTTPRLHRALVLLGVAVLLGACAAKPRAERDAPAPAEARPGVELTWWVVDDLPVEGGPPLRDTLAALASRPVPVAPESLAAWKANGLRVLAVPSTDAALLQSRLNLVGPLQNQWVGEAPSWIDLAKSAVADRSMTVVLDNGPAMFRDGRLGLAMRTWIAPDPAPTPQAATLPAAVILELAPRHVPWRAIESGLPRLPGDDTARPEPLIFDRLRLSAVMRGHDALLILPESPGEQWNAPPAAAPTASIPHIGPEVPPLPTLGEALLSDTVAVPGRRARIMILIRATIPRRFELLPAAAR